MVLAVSLVLGAISLMGLSQGDREQRGYEALSRAAVTGINDEPGPSAGQEDSQQQQQMGTLSASSINSGSLSLCTYLYFVLIVTFGFHSGPNQSKFYM